MVTKLLKGLNIKNNYLKVLVKIYKVLNYLCARTSVCMHACVRAVLIVSVSEKEVGAPSSNLGVFVAFNFALIPFGKYTDTSLAYHLILNVEEK